MEWFRNHKKLFVVSNTIGRKKLNEIYILKFSVRIDIRLFFFFYCDVTITWFGHHGTSSLFEDIEITTRRMTS